MNISFEELRRVKHSLPTRSISRMASQLSLPEQTIRNYFGAEKYKDGTTVDRHVQPGPNGGIVHLEDTSILELARQIIEESRTASTM